MVRLPVVFALLLFLQNISLASDNEYHGLQDCEEEQIEIEDMDLTASPVQSRSVLELAPMLAQLGLLISTVIQVVNAYELMKDMEPHYHGAMNIITDFELGELNTAVLKKTGPTSIIAPLAYMTLKIMGQMYKQVTGKVLIPAKVLTYVLGMTTSAGLGASMAEYNALDLFTSNLDPLPKPVKWITNAALFDQAKARYEHGAIHAVANVIANHVLHKWIEASVSKQKAIEDNQEDDPRP